MLHKLNVLLGWLWSDGNNIRFLVNNDIHCLDKKAYNYYRKYLYQCYQRHRKENNLGTASPKFTPMPIEVFIDAVKGGVGQDGWLLPGNRYKLGDTKERENLSKYYVK